MIVQAVGRLRRVTMRSMEAVLGVLLLGIGLASLYSLWRPDSRVASFVLKQNTFTPSKNVSPRMERAGVELSKVLGPFFTVLGIALLVLAAF